MSPHNRDISVRAAKVGDESEMSAILAEILTQWGSDRPRSPEYNRTFYIEHPDQISCAVAVNGAGDVLGFQSLKRAIAGNPYDVTTGWGIIGTYVKLGVGRCGVGSRLFAATSRLAHQGGVRKIDATIDAHNKSALLYYEAMGFRTYRTKSGTICKCYSLAPQSQE